MKHFNRQTGTIETEPSEHSVPVKYQPESNCKHCKGTGIDGKGMFGLKNPCRCLKPQPQSTQTHPERR